MPDLNETHIKNEISEISKRINAILKKIEQEREKFLPASSEDNSSKNQNIPAKDDQKNESSVAEIETTGKPTEK
jgi:hypothetical protein